ncbi:YadA family autotransporter adhesin, partial [Psychrobacter sp. UBA3480]
QDGAQGPQGEQGPAGQDGIDGAKGDKGDSGISEAANTELESKIEDSQARFFSVNGSSDSEDAGNYNSNGATADGAIAIGVNAQSKGKDSIAMGTNNTVTGDQSTSVGNGNIVSGDRSGAFGDPNIIGGSANYAVGNDNIIGDTTSNSVVLGSNATVGATAATIGANSAPTFANETNASNSVAIGESVNVQAANAVSIGANSSATHSNAVALGANSQSTADNTVSVGSANNQRRITNVAAGINSNDAVNVSQLNQNRAEAFGYTDRRINDLEGETHSAVAGALAFGALRYPNTPGKVSVGLGGGTWEGETGYAFGVGYTTSDGQFSISSAFGGSGSQNGGNVGVSYTFD